MIFSARRRLTFSLLATAVVGGALSLFACNGQLEPPAPLRPVKLVTLGGTAVSPSMELAGDVRARVESRLGFRTAGKIISRRVEAGQRVKRGDELARIDPRDYQLSRTAADSQVTARRADVEIAQSEYRRFQDLRKQGYVSEQELDRKRVTLAVAESLLRQAESGASLEGNRLGDTVLRAIADGVITGIDADVGEVVVPGASVIRLAQDGPREIAVEFPEDRMALAHVAQAEVWLWAQPDIKYSAQLRELAASADSVTRTFHARYSVKAPANALVLGQSATLRLVLPAQSGGMRLPTTAFIGDSLHGASVSGAAPPGGSDSATRVWIYDPETSRVRRVPVQIVGLDGNDFVVAGLVPGTQVVVAGVHVLTEGQKVRPLGAGVPDATAALAVPASGARTP
ncbi:MAG: efflux RND transporter periplasmic adaptor subunit [Pseudomonadota bacterium]